VITQVASFVQRSDFPCVWAVGPDAPLWLTNILSSFTGFLIVYTVILLQLL